MADAVTTQILHNGPRNAVIKFTNVSDGTGETAVLKVNMALLTGLDGTLNTHPSAVRIERIDYLLFGMQVQILWDATTDVVAIELVPDGGDSIDMRNYGGITNNSGTGKTGNINFTTVGASAGDSYTIVLSMIKVYS